MIQWYLNSPIGETGSFTPPLQDTAETWNHGKRILTEQICPKISNHKLVAQYKRYNQSTPFQP